MDRSVGEVVVIIDADLQDPPEVIVEMIDRWKEGYQVVYAKRRTREGEGLFKKITAALFYRILEKLTPIDIPVDTGDFRLLDRKVVTQLIQMREKNRFVRGMVSWVGFKQCKVEYEREKRFAGETKYPLRKMLRFAMDGILSFSQVPLKISSFFGFVCAGISFLLIIYGLVRKAFFPEAVIIGWASTFVTVLFLGGVQLISVGILGEYLGRMYDEIKGRPLYIIDEEINFT
jgi:dolichol-phosphate mannosyltransferase